MPELAEEGAVEIDEAEQPDAEYPTLLTTGRVLYHYNNASLTRREDGMRLKLDEPFVEVNSEDARSVGVADGEPLRLVSRRGEVVASARLGEKVRPGVVWMSFHFAEANANWLTNDAHDERTGTPEYKVCAVRLEKP